MPNSCSIYRFYWAQGRQGPEWSTWTAGTPRPDRKIRCSGSSRTEGLSWWSFRSSSRFPRGCWAPWLPRVERHARRSRSTWN